MAGNKQELTHVVERTINALKGARLPLEMPGSLELKEQRNRLITQLETRILPHLRSDSLPGVVVFGGSSGAGKSTLFNTLIGEEISPASVLRPTTRVPVIGIHPDDVAAMEGHALLSMGRTAVVRGGIPGLVIVDAPDLDSVEENNREVARRLLDAADLWVFVTTAARYGDAVAWRMLTDAYRRGMTVAVVLDRVPEKAVRTVGQDLRRRMIDEGIGDTPLLVVPDVGPHEGLLPSEAAASVRAWLAAMAQSHMGATLAERTTRTTVPDIRRGLLDLAEAVEHQANALQDLKDQASVAVTDAAHKVTVNALNGRFGQGAPTATWLTFSSSGGVLDCVAAGAAPGLFRRKAFAERDKAMTIVFDAALSAIRVAVHQGIVSADEAIAQSWRRDAVDTAGFERAGHARVDAVHIENVALIGWKRDIWNLVPAHRTSAWFTKHGQAALLGAAAAGVSGAQRALGAAGLSQQLRPAREALAARCEAAIEAVSHAYCDALADVPIGNGRQLRLRASEYLDGTESIADMMWKE
jgi:GTPase